MASNAYEIDSEIIASRNNDGSIVAMKVDDSDLFYKITGVATTVWTHLENGLTLEEITNQVMDEFDVAEDILKSDIDKFIIELKKFNIIREK